MDDEECCDLEMEQSNPSLTEKQLRIVEELCTCNGVNYEKLKDGVGSDVEKLEMFFSGYPQMLGLSYFPNLRSLCLIGQDVLTEIEGLQSLVHLEELWICEANIKVIQGVEKCQKLRRLYLYDNALDKIENLSKLALLEVLWLNDNLITCIEGLDHLLNLKDLNLSNNKICHIGNSLEKLTELEILHLSGNQIRSFKDLYNLVHLENLQTLSLKDPVYGENPVASICNYSTYVFYHLPALKRLDGYDVDHESLKSLAEITVKKKKMYYNMRVKTLERNMSNLMKQVEDEKQRLLEIPSKRIRDLTRTRNALHRCSMEETCEEKCAIAENGGSECEPSDESLVVSRKKLVEGKIEDIQERLEDLEDTCDNIEECFHESRSQVQQISQATVQRLFLELETGGNVRFEDGTPNDVWYTSCYDLVLSRFCAGDFKGFDINGIKIHRITRVQNRVLRVSFDEKVNDFVGRNVDMDVLDQKELVRNSVEYLFTVWDPALKRKNELLRLLEDGYKEAGGDDFGGVHLTNNVFDSDAERLKFLKDDIFEASKPDRRPYRHGQLVVAKVFIGNMKLAGKETSITKNNFPGVDSVFVHRDEDDNDEAKVENFSSSRTISDSCCDCRTKQGDWIVFDTDLVLPEYVVDFEYLTKVKPVSSLICYYGDTSDKKNSDEDAPDCDLLETGPLHVQPKPRLMELCEKTLLQYCGVESLQNITVLNLHDNGLVRLNSINNLSNLSKLIISFNSLTKLHDINGMHHLSYVDVSFNNISTLEGIKDLPCLSHLDISWNKLKHIRDEIGILRKHVTSLTSLDTRHNPWLRADNYRTYTIGRLRTLQKLDGSDITEQEHALALRHAALSRISAFSILAHSRTDQDDVRSLSLTSTASVIVQHSKNKPVLVGDDSTQWMQCVTTLQVDGQGISKLSNLDKLQRLRWASFNDNNINRIEGLEACFLLEELSISRNCVSKLEGLVKLTNLRRLTLDGNNITCLEGNVMEHLVHLEYLSVENNHITSIQGLKKCLQLQELYAGNNCVSNSREVFHLKSLQNLDILDLSGNPVASANENHRLFVVYHLSTLKALNGVAVTTTERSNAKEILGGRMTTDFVAEHLGHANFAELQEIDLPNCELRTIDVGNGEVFKNLRSINLEHNNLTCFGGLIHLINLKVLCLNHNKIDCVFPRRQTNKKSPSNDITCPEQFTPVLEKLEVLHLGYNGIANLKALQLFRIANLKALFLQGNEISKVEGLETLQELRELVLDQNKIKSLSETSFIGQRKLQELHLEDNRLKDLSNLEPLFNIQRLYLGMNKIQELSELNKLERFNNLFEISLVSNPVTRRLMHRPILVYRLSNVLCIDGIPVTNEERTKAEVYLTEHQLVPAPSTDHADSNLPILSSKPQAPLKVTTVQLSTSFDGHLNHRPGHMEYLEGINPTHSRYYERNGVLRGKPRGISNSYSSHSLSEPPSSMELASLRLGRPPPQPSHARSQGHMPTSGAYSLRGNHAAPNFPSPPRK